jgi:hypothetical protein
MQRDLMVRLRTDPGEVEFWVEINGRRVAATAWLRERLKRGGGAVPTGPEGGAGVAAWSEENYQARLLAIYAELPDLPAVGVEYLDRRRLLDRCLTPETFHFLCGY